MEKYNQVLDIGNTHIVMGIYSENGLIRSWRLTTDKSKTEDEYFSVIKPLLSENSINIKNIVSIAISSVVPNLTRVFEHLIQKYFFCSPIIVNSGCGLGLKFPMKDPGFIGADLVVNAFAAKEKYKTNCIIFDFGTATTIQLVGADGFFYGTIIYPGVITSAKNLFETTSQLSNIKFQKPENILGTTTRDALLSGIITGNTFMLDGFIGSIRKEYKHLGKIKVIATGGIADLVCENSKEVDIIDKHLTLDGLNLICQKHLNE